MVAFEEVEVEVDMPLLLPRSPAPAPFPLVETETEEERLEEAKVCMEAESSAGEARSEVTEYSSQQQPTSFRSCSSILILEQYRAERASSRSASRTLRGFKVHLR